MGELNLLLLFAPGLEPSLGPIYPDSNTVTVIPFGTIWRKKKSVRVRPTATATERVSKGVAETSDLAPPRVQLGFFFGTEMVLVIIQFHDHEPMT